MSPETIDRRLREVAQLYRLGVEIRNARRLGKVTDVEKLAKNHHRATHRFTFTETENTPTKTS